MDYETQVSVPELKGYRITHMLLPGDVTPSQRALHVGMMIIRLKPDKRVYVVVG